ncbi:MAG TPA: serine hydrolase domain-containing protein [Spirochaetia bacterium]|nr:serine hydrolase domain-containing protein [Spirochaetia bacterium]
MSRLERLTPLLESFVKNGPPGCACKVERAGKVLYERYVGLSDVAARRPVTPDLIYRFYSNSKPITCVAALVLYERGAYQMNDPLSEYLPEFRDVRVYQTGPNGTLTAEPAKRSVRIRDLFTMTSGLCYPGDDVETARQVAVAQREMESRLGPAGYDVRTMSRTLAGIPLAFEPGTHWRYGLSHDVLGALIEVLSGKSLGRFLEEEIFTPLGMKDTSFRLPKEKAGRLCPMYDRSAEGALTRNDSWDAPYQPDARFESGGGGLLSTVADYGRFGQMLAHDGALQGTRILGGRTVQLMRTNHLNAEVLKDYNWEHMAGYGYGLGVRVMIDPAAQGSNGTIGEFGWGGLAGTWLLADAKEELSVVYAQQTMPNQEPIHQTLLRNVVYGGL